MSARQSAEVSALFDRYLVSLDDDELDDNWARSLFTEHARIEFPMSQHEGIDGLAAYHRQALAMFERTQHMNSPAVVEIDGYRASLRANLISTHVHLPANAPPSAGHTPVFAADARHSAAHPPVFAAGTFVTGEAHRRPDGWRFSRLSFRLIWATGSPPPPPDA